MYYNFDTDDECRKSGSAWLITRAGMERIYGEAKAALACEENSCQRPAYTNYELSMMVRQQRAKMSLGIEEFACRYGLSASLVDAIEKAERSFNVPMYKACSSILGISLEEISKLDSEDLNCVNYRAKRITEETRRTVEKANEIFNEMVMQLKISAR